MPNHVLLEKATRRPYRDEPEMPKDASYNPGKGIWEVGEKPYISSSTYTERGTKKCDQETGEDQKGE